MKKTISVRTKVFTANIASFEISLNNQGKLVSVFNLVLPTTCDPFLLANLSAGFGVGIAANFVHADDSITDINLEIPLPLHPAWNQISELFSELTGVNLRLVNVFHAPTPPAASGQVFLVSGGKDTLYVLEKNQHLFSTSTGTPGIYLGAGAELNWPEELTQVLRLANHFKLDLHHVPLFQQHISSKGILRFGNRAAWRELVTLTLARGFGDHIYTGINIDAIAQLNFKDAHYADFLSQLVPTLQAMELILGAKIETAPGEFEVYKAVRQHPLWNQAGSCLRPDCGQPALCAKCRTFKVYDYVLAGQPLPEEDVAFIHSDFYLGDAAVLTKYPRKPTHLNFEGGIDDNKIAS